MNKIILASGSPRRKDILTAHGIDFEILVSDVDESFSETNPKKVVEELSRRKAKAVWEEHQNRIVLGADTVVAYEDEILGKPKDDKDAFRMIHLIQGKRHQVYTGVTIYSKEKMVTFSEKTDVIVAPMTDEEIKAYIATKEGIDKAGSYAIQGLFGRYILGYDGDYENVVGLPGKRVEEILKSDFWT